MSFANFLETKKHLINSNSSDNRKSQYRDRLLGKTKVQHSHTNDTRSVLDYTSPDWVPCTSQTQHNMIRKTHNRAFTIKTGCTQTMPAEHMYCTRRQKYWEFAKRKVFISVELLAEMCLNLGYEMYVANSLQQPQATKDIRATHYMHNCTQTPSRITNTTDH